MIHFFQQLRNRLRRLMHLADAAENTIEFSKYISGRTPGQERELVYEPTPANEPLPVPPQSLWLGYGHSPESYVESGLTDLTSMASILKAAGFDLSATTRPVLDLGCGGGRMLRHLRDTAQRTEVWGLDISAPHIGWLKTHLSPPFQFAVTTTLPHLPFPDSYFGLIYCGSVFTHIDDFAESWMLEVRRVLAPGAFLYCTFHDEHTRASLLAKPEQKLARHLRDHGHPLMDPSAKLPDILIMGTNADSNVFYHSRYLRAMISPLFEIVAVVPEAYGYQTGWVLRKRPPA